MHAREHRVCRRLRRDAGFTLVEVMVAALVLIVGVMGTFVLLDSSTRAFGSSRAREGASGIAREVLEDARVTSYSALNSAALLTVMQNLSGFQSTSGPTSVTVLRRNTTFTVTGNVCEVDDPRDGYGNHSAGNFCSDSSTTGTADSQPDDLKRVSVTVSWSAPRPGQLTQTMTLSSSGQALGPPTQTFTMDSPTGVGSDPTAPVITNSSTVAGSCASGTACFTASSTGAQRIVFAIDGTDQATGVTTDSSCVNYPTQGCGKWHFTWSLSGLSDGPYRVTARAVDANGAQGPPQTIVVTLNRGITATVCGVGSTSGTCLPIAGGYNTINVSGTPTTVTEFQWQANAQRNVVGYEVDNPSGTAVCNTTPQSASPTSCIDFSPPAPSGTNITYTVYALFTDANGNTVKGQGSTVSFNGGTSGYSTTNTYGLSATAANAGGTCPSSGIQDLAANFTGAASYTDFFGTSTGTTTITFCTPPLPAGTVSGTMSMGSLFFLNQASSNKTCNVSWSLQRNATGAALASGSGVAIGGGTRYTAISASNQAVTSTTLSANDKLSLSFSMTGSNCASTSLRYGGNASTVPANTPAYPEPGSLSVSEQVAPTPWPSPAAPTGVTAVASAGVTNVSWTAPAGAVAFYRIYRDGQNYGDRYDTCEPNDNYCDKGSGNFTFTDYNTGGTTHTYWITAVGATSTTPSVPTMAESAFSNGATG